MIGTSEVIGSGYEGGSYTEIKEFLKDKIATRYCTATQYYQMKRMVLDKIAEINERRSAAFGKFVADIKDPDVVSCGVIRIYRTRATTPVYVAEVRVYYVLPFCPADIQAEGGEAWKS